MTGERPKGSADRVGCRRHRGDAGSATAAIGGTPGPERPKFLRSRFAPILARVDREPWLAISSLVGYTGTQRGAQVCRLDGLFGHGAWRIAWRLGGAVIDRAEALKLYEDAYFEFFRATSALIDWLCRTASNVYDNALTNVASGLDYAVQEAASTHLQDIAVRRCLVRFGRRFEGDHLVEIRGASSEGYQLNPGLVPFHRPEEIVASEERSWWSPESVEAFWQHNKVVVVSPEAVRGRPSFAGPEGIWVDLDGEASLLVPRNAERFLRVARSRTLRRRTNGPAGTRDLSRIVGGPRAAVPFEILADLSRNAACPGTEPRVEWKDLVGERTAE